MTNENLTIAVPKGRILEELMPLFKKVGLTPDKDFFDENSRALRFDTNKPGVQLIRVRSFDVATFVAFGAAEIGIVGSDVLMEFDYPDIYAPIDLGIGKCRLSIAAPEMSAIEDFRRLSHVRVATKYPNLTRKHFAKYGVQAECVKLNGAMELAPTLGLSELIVDLVSSGKTLKANRLKEVDTILDISSRLIVNRLAFKTRQEILEPWLARFRRAV